MGNTGNPCVESASALAGCISAAVINPIIALIFATGLMVFVWGVVQFMIGLSGGEGGESVQDGKKHMLWGLIGMFIMVAAFAFVKIIARTLSVDLP